MIDKEYGDPATYYDTYYDLLTCGKPDGFVAKLTHHSMERTLPGKKSSRLSTSSKESEVMFLEVGAGTGTHLNFVESTFDKYIVSDISEKSLGIAKLNFKHDSRNLVFETADAEKLEFADNQFDRVIASCVILHLKDPESALREWIRVTKPGGVMTVYVPSDPEPLLRIARKISTERSAKKAGFKGFNLLMAREHRNTARNIDIFVKFLSKNHDLKIFTWPLRHSPISLRVFTIYHLTKCDS